MIHKLEYLLKHSLYLQKIYIFLFSFIFKILSLFIKPDKKQILFQSLIGKNYGDSVKTIYDDLLKDKRFADYHFVWAFDEPKRFEIKKGTKVKLNSFVYYKTALSSGIWVGNTNIERGLRFKPDSIISLNTWHGIPIKTIGNAQRTRKDYDYSDLDFMCYSSDFDKHVFMNDFKIKETSLYPCGMPRNDVLYHPDPEMKKQVYRDFNINEDKKILLYAPTWRDSDDKGKSYLIDPPLNLKHWKEMLGHEYVLLFRSHPITNKIMNIEFDEFVKDASDYSDVNALMIASDMLISDYSSLFFDYSILEKPMICFAYDHASYKESRGFYEETEKDIIEVFGYDNEEDILKHILFMDRAIECLKTKKVKEKYMPEFPDATKICIDFLVQKSGVGHVV